MFTNARSVLVFAALMLSCRREEAPRPSREADDALLTRTESAATRLATTLRGRLVATLQAQGPVAAVEVCAREAPELIATVRRETGVTVGRSSLRLRSPADTPPPWVEEWLRAQGERRAEGVTGVREVRGERARVLRPIAVEGPCVLCHGAPETIPEGVRAALAARYPGDRATGYQVGDLRGALWAEAARR
jgi:hypothetical protein